MQIEDLIGENVAPVDRVKFDVEESDQEDNRA
jgi:hypothetical protein